MNHRTHSKGDIGVAKVISDLTCKRLKLFLPLSSSISFDLVVFKNNKFYKVEVKYRKMIHGKVIARARIHFNPKKYRLNNSYDVIAIYVPEVDKCYYIKRNDISKSISLRINKSKNNQKKNTIKAEKFLKFPY